MSWCRSHGRGRRAAACASGRAAPSSDRGIGSWRARVRSNTAKASPDRPGRRRWALLHRVGADGQPARRVAYCLLVVGAVVARCLIGSHQARLSRYQATVAGRPSASVQLRRPAERPRASPCRARSGGRGRGGRRPGGSATRRRPVSSSTRRVIVEVLDLLAAADVVDLARLRPRGARARSRRSGPRRRASRAPGGRRRRPAAARRRARS